MNEEQKRILEKLDVKNGKGQAFLDRIVIDKAENAPKDLEDAANATRKATEIMKDEKIQKKLNELSEVISEKLDPTKLLGDSPHKDKVDYFVKHADEYVLDKKTGNYILREVVKQVSAQLVARSREDKKQEEEKNTSKNDGR